MVCNDMYVMFWISKRKLIKLSQKIRDVILSHSCCLENVTRILVKEVIAVFKIFIYLENAGRVSTSVGIIWG